MVIFLLLCVIAIPLNAATQETPLGFSLNITPRAPQPGDIVTINASYFSSNLDVAHVEWRVNGKVASSGRGLKQFTLTLPDELKTTTVTFAANIDGDYIEKTVKIHPAYVDILWQANATAPPLYPGKKLLPNEGEATFFAFAHFPQKKREELLYYWYINGNPLVTTSPRGQDTVTVDLGIFITSNLHVAVVVMDEKKEVVARNEVRITSVRPYLLFYENAAITGTRYEHVISSPFTVTQNQFTLRAEPFFFPMDDPLGWEWRINNVPTENNSSNPKLLPLLLASPDMTGESIITVRVNNKNKLLQTTTKSLTVTF